jgi:hypothetical protein
MHFLFIQPPFLGALKRTAFSLSLHPDFLSDGPEKDTLLFLAAMGLDTAPSPLPF